VLECANTSGSYCCTQAQALEVWGDSKAARCHPPLSEVSCKHLPGLLHGTAGRLLYADNYGGPGCCSANLFCEGLCLQLISMLEFSMSSMQLLLMDCLQMVDISCGKRMILSWHRLKGKFWHACRSVPLHIGPCQLCYYNICCLARFGCKCLIGRLKAHTRRC
jgi:hypothetical protein